MDSKYKDLTPIDNADQNAEYYRALSYAFSNNKILNIAISGPYGSGKSSIIKTFEKNNPAHTYLNISLASFKETEDGSGTKDSIERSILQQILYGADSNNLPYSRFKRIYVPKLPLLKSFLFIFWIISCIFLFITGYEWMLHELNTVTRVISYLSLVYSISFLIILTLDIYRLSFSLQIKKLSLKNAEFEVCDVAENSLLNKHLDEILYFFQATKYNAVIIEDLDRFNDPEIFVKLREINKLVNDNDKGRRTIKFVYAIKDDMFAHDKRAKFFDFIIPVIPIINTTNSLDKIQERIRELKLKKDINEQFLREVSLYLNDYRLIHNIFNEFIIYHEQLKSDSLDVTKLLAMIIYKNVYPQDFENLHYGKGFLYKVCEEKAKFVEINRSLINEKIDSLKERIKASQDEKISNINELISGYIGKILSYSPVNTPIYGIACDNKHIHLSNITDFEQFKFLLDESDIKIALQAQVHKNHRRSIGKSFSDIEEEVKPGETFLSRKEYVEESFDLKKQELLEVVHSHEKKKLEVVKKPLNEIIVESNIDLEDYILNKTDEDYSLLFYLLNNGYLDENYHLYISNFYEGRLSSRDRDFLLTIRNFKTPDPLQKVDTPREVCANMRDEDFSNKYVLNITLIDFLITEKTSFRPQLDSALKYLSEQFELCHEFIDSYFSNGRNIEKFVYELSHVWAGYAQSATTLENSPEHILHIIKNVEPEYIIEKMNIDNSITNYLSKNLQNVLALDNSQFNNYELLKGLSVHLENLNLFKDLYSLVEYAHQNHIYAINTNNIEFLLLQFPIKKNLNTNDINRKNYTSICEVGSSELKTYIESNFNDYIKNVFLILTENIDESGSSILSILNNEFIDINLKREVVSKESHIFESFEELPISIWGDVLSDLKIEITWENLSRYISIEDNDKSIVTDLLNSDENIQNLIRNDFKAGDESEILSRFILNNDDIEDSKYDKLIQYLPYIYNEFPSEISDEKYLILAKYSKVELNEESFQFAQISHELLSTLIENNLSTYLNNLDIFQINDETREILLSKDIGLDIKLAICKIVSLSSIENSERLATIISNILSSQDTDPSDFTYDYLKSVILNTSDTSRAIEILIRSDQFWESEPTIMDILSKFPEPYNIISNYGKNPKIENNDLNNRLTEKMMEKGFISKVKKYDKDLKIYTFKSSDHNGDETETTSNN